MPDNDRINASEHGRSSKPVPNRQASPDVDSTLLELPIEQIRPYEQNPRRQTNEALAELKDSIRAKGIMQHITVTQRPGQDYYIPYSGGNSRYVCARQLFDEGERRFARLHVFYRKFTTESDVLASHLVENNVRGEVAFWDKACSAMQLKQMLEQELGRELSMRDLERLLAARGLPNSHAHFVYFKFAHLRLSALGDAGYFVTRNAIRDHIQKRFRRWDAIGQRANKFERMRADIDATLAHIGQAAVKVGALDAKAMCDEIEALVAATVGVDPPRLARMLPLAEQFGELSWEQLLEQTKPALLPPGSAGSIKPGQAQPAVALAKRLSQPLATPADARPPDQLGAALESAAQFARLCSVADCLEQLDTMPLGFYVEVPRDGPLGLDPAAPLRHQAWWMLMYLSQQCDAEVSGKLPQDSAWRRHHLIEGDLSEEDFANLLQSRLGGPIAPHGICAFVTSPFIPAGAAYLDLLHTVRQVKLRHPERFPACEAAP